MTHGQIQRTLLLTDNKQHGLQVDGTYVGNCSGYKNTELWELSKPIL